MSGIIMYHGAECPHCRAMMPLVDKLRDEDNIDIEKKEVWHNQANADEMRSHQDIIAPACGGDLGVPGFYSTTTNEALCGEISYEKLKEWAAANK